MSDLFVASPRIDQLEQLQAAGATYQQVLDATVEQANKLLLADQAHSEQIGQLSSETQCAIEELMCFIVAVMTTRLVLYWCSLQT